MAFALNERIDLLSFEELVERRDAARQAILQDPDDEALKTYFKAVVREIGGRVGPLRAMIQEALKPLVS